MEDLPAFCVGVCMHVCTCVSGLYLTSKNMLEG